MGVEHLQPGKRAAAFKCYLLFMAIDSSKLSEILAKSLFAANLMSLKFKRAFELQYKAIFRGHDDRTMH